MSTKPYLESNAISDELLYLLKLTNFNFATVSEVKHAHAVQSTSIFFFRPEKHKIVVLVIRHFRPNATSSEQLLDKQYLSTVTKCQTSI